MKNKPANDRGDCKFDDENHARSFNNLSGDVRECDQMLDTSGLNCPLPLLRLKKALVSMKSGDTIQVLSTDPASALDFGVFSEQTGNQILDQYDQEGTLYYLIKKK